MPDILPGQTEMEEQESDRQEEGQGNPFLILPDGRTGIKKRGNISHGTMETEPDEEAAHEIMLEEAEQGMRMPCTTWERFMRRALAVRQIKKWQMCGTKKH